MWKKFQIQNCWCHLTIPTGNQPIWNYLTFQKRRSLEKYTLLKRSSSQVHNFHTVVTEVITFSWGIGDGDVSYNPRRSLPSALSVSEKIAYHLFNIGYSCQKNSSNSVKLLKKSKWHLQHTGQSNLWIFWQSFVLFAIIKFRKLYNKFGFQSYWRDCWGYRRICTLLNLRCWYR